MDHDDTARLAALYAARRTTFDTERAQFDRASLQMSWTRGALFALALLVIYAVKGAGWIAASTGWALAAAIGVGFLVVIRRHDRIERAKAVAGAQVRLADEAVARLERRWDALPGSQREKSDEERCDPVGRDLDLWGRGSLRQLIGRSATPGGAGVIDAWMQQAVRGEVQAEVIAARQQAVRELAPQIDLRLALVAGAMAGEPLRRHTAGAVDAWIASPRGALLRWPVLALACVSPVAALLAAIGVLPADGATAVFLIAPLVSWGLRQALAQSIGRAFAAADALSGEGRRYVEMLRTWERYAPQSPRIAALRARLGQPHPASDAFTRLRRLVELADLRWSHLPHFFIHSVTTWDVHVAAALERWRVEWGGHVGDWFEALGELDALATLAGLAHDEPAWCDATIAREVDRVEATAIAHPMLSPRVRIANDVTVGPAGSALVITGSNMSGKSTLLRAVGLNAVLAQMGAPACAGRLQMPVLRLESSIRITDSLTDGVSYFMSALLRLRAIVAAADASAPPATPVVCYLLDEVLHGTNSEERQVAVRRVLAHLVTTPAIGAMTTHDLHLVHTPEFQAHARHVHFTEHVDEQAEPASVTFDYRLRPGPATSRNALALMRMIGLGHLIEPSAAPITPQDQ